MVVQHAEIRTADDLQVIGQAGMANGEIIGREPGVAGQLVGERHERIVDDLRIAVIFHHDQEYMVEMADAMRHRTFVGGSRRGKRNRCDAGEQ